VYAQFVLSVGGQGWGWSASLCRALVAGVNDIFLMRKDQDFVCILSIFERGWECMCVYSTHTHTPRGVLGCESRGRDEILGRD